MSTENFEEQANCQIIQENTTEKVVLGFDQQKKKALEDLNTDDPDLSRKGHIDEEIKYFVDIINNSKDFYTTSSCAGRVVLTELPTEKKYDAIWAYSSHQPAVFEDVKKELHATKHITWFKSEPPIIHVAARNLELAHKFLVLLKKHTFKRSGIVSIGRKLIIELIGNERINTPVSNNSEVLISDEYLKQIVKEANDGMKTNRDNLKNFSVQFQKEFN